MEQKLCQNDSLGILRKRQKSRAPLSAEFKQLERFVSYKLQTMVKNSLETRPHQIGKDFTIKWNKVHKKSIRYFMYCENAKMNLWRNKACKYLQGDIKIAINHNIFWSFWSVGLFLSQYKNFITTFMDFADCIVSFKILNHRKNINQMNIN